MSCVHGFVVADVEEFYQQCDPGEARLFSSFKRLVFSFHSNDCFLRLVL